MTFFQDCIDIGVKGFKIDSAKYMDPIDIEVRKLGKLWCRMSQKMNDNFKIFFEFNHVKLISKVKILQYNSNWLKQKKNPKNSKL